MIFPPWTAFNRLGEKAGNKTQITAFVLILALAISLYALYVGVYMDDVLIYLRVARNIVDGHGPVFNPGDRHFPVTSPLWVFLLAFFQKLLPAPGLMVWSKVLFIAFLAGASFLFFQLLRKRLGIWAALAPLPLFFNPVTLTCGGGECALLYFALLGMIHAATRRENSWLLGLFAALAYLARGEAVLMLLPILFWRLWLLLRKKIAGRRFAVEILQAAAVFLAVALIWHGYYYLHFHGLFPETLQTKIVQGSSGKWAMYHQKMRPHILQFFQGRWYLLPLLLAGFSGLGAWTLMLLAFTCLHYYAYAWLSIPFYHWYFYDIDLLLAAVPLFGALWLLSVAGRRLTRKGVLRGPGPKVLSRAAALAIAVFLAVTIMPLRRLADFRFDNRIRSYGRLCSWLDKRLQPGDAVLAREVGIIGYLLPKARVFDTNGIATTGVTVDNIEDLEHFANRFRPAYLLLRDDADEMKIFANQKGCLLYKRVLRADATGGSGGPYPSALYQRIADYDPPPGLRGFLDLARGRICSWQMAFRQIEKRWVLFAHALFISRVAVPPEATRISISIGYIPEFYREGIAFSDGVELRLIGVNGDKETQLRRMIFDPAREKSAPDAEKILDAEFPAGTYQYIRLVIYPRRSNDCDWTYIGSFSFH